MSKRHIVLSLVGAALMAGPAMSQTTAPSSSPPATNPPAATAPATNTPAASMQKHMGQWRASKLIGVDVYNNNNEKIGDINEVLLDRNGKVENVVIGVGGFLGMGEHDVAVGFDKLKWSNEPVRSTTADNKNAAPATTTGRANDNSARAANDLWYPNHAIMDATKDQLKAMPEFKYSNYN